MSIVPFSNETRLPAAFQDEGLNRLYSDTYSAMADSFRSNPALGVMHHMMAERLAYIYVKSIEVGRQQNVEPHVERSFLEAFNRLVAELGRETRVQAREGAFKQALIAGVVLVLREELDSQPVLTQRIMQRLQEL